MARAGREIGNGKVGGDAGFPLVLRHGVAYPLPIAGRDHAAVPTDPEAGPGVRSLWNLGAA